MALSMHVAAYLDGDLVPEPPLEPGYPFGHMLAELKAYDLLVGNLECVVTNRGSPNIPRPLKAPLKTPELLLSSGFDVVSIANNHVEDMGDKGYLDMMRRLEEAKLPYVGGTLVDATRDPNVIRTVGGTRVAIVGHYERSHRAALEDVKRARATADVVVVFPHWGIDMGYEPTRYQRQWARKLIDAGADAVVGAHSHIVHPQEIYQGKLIAYSLGNFVFSGMVRPATRVGALLELDVTPKGIAAHRYRRVAMDERGAPRLVGEPTSEPALEPQTPSKLRDLGKPIDFDALER